jgi:uncharacterized protein YutE (UPF0331/DUF86 family)
MYFVDRKKVEATLKFVEHLLKEYKGFRVESYHEKLALERLSQLLIESIIDAGNMMIDGFIMRDPGSYEDIIDILEDERVIPKSESDSYKEVISLRKMLVKDYLHIDHDKLNHVLGENFSELELFTSRIREYLNSEIGVANAFTKE